MAVKKRATKKKVAKKKATRSKEMVSMADWEKRMAEAASAQESLEQTGSGSAISTRNGKFSYQGTTIGYEMDVIVLGFSHARAWYDQAYDSDEQQSPACFAISEDGLEESPHEDSPVPQADICANCEYDAWGSANTGNGKACRQHRRLMVMAWQDDLHEADVASVNVPPASLKNWKGYIKKVSKQLHRPCYGVVTKMSFDQDADYATMDFDMVEQINDPADMQVVMDAVETIEDDLMRPYDVSNYEAPQSKPKKRATKKKVAKKKSARRSKF